LYFTNTQEQKYGVTIQKNSTQRKNVSFDNSTTNLRFPGLSPVDSTETILPVGTIKRILTIDSENGRISRDALVLLTKAAEFFAIQCSKGCQKMAALQKRKLIRLSDFVYLTEHSSQYEFARSLVRQLSHESELNKEKENENQVLADDDPENRERAAEQSTHQANPSNKKRKAPIETNSRNIASMFGRMNTTANSTSEAISID
jgi:histone H3/H4